MEAERGSGEWQGAKWYEEAGNQGDLEALYNLGYMYQEGRGVTRDYGRANTLYLEVVDKGRFAEKERSSKALDMLGNSYHLGQGVLRDDVEAYKWYILAAAAGHPDGARQMRELEQFMTAAQLPMVPGYSRFLTLLLLLTCALRSEAQAFPRLGQPAPPLTLTHLLQAPERSSATWDALRGRAVVLEFWATWCGGCVAHIPQINELAGKFSGQPILFISVTDEEESTVLRFLKTHPISGWVALDPKRSTFDAYRVEGIPQTFLVDANGKLRAMTQPNRLNDQVIEDLLAGRTPDVSQFNPAAATPILGTERGAPPPIVQVLVRPAASVDVSRYTPGARALINGRYEAYGVTLRDILADAYDFPVSRIDAPEWCTQVEYDVSVAVAHGNDLDRWPLLQQVLTTAFHLRIHREMRNTAVYVLRTISKRKPNLRVSTTDEVNSRPWGRTGEFEAVGVPLKTLVGIAGIVLNSEVVDQTGMKDRYDFSLKWDPKNPLSIASAVQEQLGLELVRSQRKLEHIVIESAEEPKTW